MKPTLRGTAALFIDAGRSLGYVEQSKLFVAQLEKILADPIREPALEARELRDALTGLTVWHMQVRDRHEKSAEASRCHADAALAELEQPGARLARRLLRAARAAREAWARG